MEIEERKVISYLTADTANILTQKFSADGVQIGENHRCVYSNSEDDRDRLMKAEPDGIVSAVLAVWGAESTVDEPEIPVYPPTGEKLLEERLKALEAQNKVLAEQNALLESCILEMSEIVYAE